MRYVATFLWIKEDSLKLNVPMETKIEQIMVTAHDRRDAYNLSMDRLAKNPGAWIPHVPKRGYRFANWWVREDPVPGEE